MLTKSVILRIYLNILILIMAPSPSKYTKHVSYENMRIHFSESNKQILNNLYIFLLPLKIKMCVFFGNFNILINKEIKQYIGPFPAHLKTYIPWIEVNSVLLKLRPELYQSRYNPSAINVNQDTNSSAINNAKSMDKTVSALNLIDSQRYSVNLCPSKYNENILSENG